MELFNKNEDKHTYKSMSKLLLQIKQKITLLGFWINNSISVSPSGGLTNGESGEHTDCKPKSFREHSDSA